MTRSWSPFDVVLFTCPRQWVRDLTTTILHLFLLLIILMAVVVLISLPPSVVWVRLDIDGWCHVSTTSVSTAEDPHWLCTSNEREVREKSRVLVFVPVYYPHRSCWLECSWHTVLMIMMMMGRRRYGTYKCNNKECHHLIRMSTQLNI